MHCCKDYGGISYWIGDGFCDDVNNNEACDYDDGDCCGLSMKKNFCVKCICIGTSNSFKLMKEIHTIYIRNNMGQKCEGNCGLWVLHEILKKTYP